MYTGNASALEGWQDIGGLPDVLEALEESLVLPTKYAHLVAQAPLRLRTGVLLYGPPGCGKTHVVAAAAAATGMRFISVKGRAAIETMTCRHLLNLRFGIPLCNLKLLRPPLLVGD